jgi:hypothetical protein
MRKITIETVMAFMEARPFRKDNMTIEVLPNVTIMRLFGNAIAYRYNDPDRTLSVTNCGWKSATTKERLNAIPGVHIRQTKGKWYLNGEAWDGKLIDVI